MATNSVWTEVLAPKFTAPTVLVVVEGETIICWPNPLPIGKDKSYVVVDFLLCANSTATTTYKFPETGAVILIDASSQFPMSSWTDSGKVVAKLFDFNNDEDDYHYTVRVERYDKLSSTEEFSLTKVISMELDPGIRNGDT